MIEKYFYCREGSSSFSKGDICFLAGLTLAGGILRIYYQYHRPFLGDEVGTLIYLEKDIAFLLSHFESWLTMNYFILLEKFMSYLGGSRPISLCLVPFLAATATIPLTMFLAFRVSSREVAYLSGLLAAVNPYLISFSTFIRAYSLLTALSLLTILLYIRWSCRRTWKHGVYLAIAVYFLLLSHLNGAYTLMFVLVITLAEWLGSLKQRKDAKIRTLLPLLPAVLLICLSYVKIYPHIVIWGVPWHDVPPTPIAYIPHVFSQYFAAGYYGWFSLFLLGSGLLIVYKHAKRLSIFFPYIVLPILLASMQGISHFPWAFARFFIILVPVLIIYMSEGIYFFASQAPKKGHWISLFLAMLLIITWVPNLYKVYGHKMEYPWHQVGDFLKKNYHQGDTIIFGAWHIRHNLVPYLSSPSFVQQDLTDFSRAGDEEPGKGRLFFLVAEPFLLSDYPNHTWGKLQVIIYPQGTKKQTLVAVFEDLRRSIKIGDLAPNLTDHYRNLWEIGKNLHRHERLRHYQLYMICKQLTERERNIPLNLKIQESKELIKMTPLE